MKTYFVESVIIAGLMCFGFGCLGRIRIRTQHSSNTVQRPIIDEVSHQPTKMFTEQGERLETTNQSLDLEDSLATLVKPSELD